MIPTYSDMLGDLSDAGSWFLALLQPEAFIVEGGNNNLCLERSALSIPLSCTCCTNAVAGCSSSKIRRCKTLPKSCEASITQAK